jgi:hypothetical protein
MGYLWPAVIAPLWLVAVATASGPVLKVDQRVVDFGVVPREASRERVLHVRNHGARPVRLLATDADCTCLFSELSADRLEPGAAAEWRVTLETCDYTGEVRRHVWLDSDDPDRPRLKVPVRYRVVEELFTEPSFVPLGLIVDDPLELVVPVKTADDQTVELLSASCTDPYVEVLIEADQVTRQEPGRLRVRVHGPVPEGRFRPVIWVDTTSAAVPRLRIPAYGESLAGLRCDCRAAAFGEIPLGTSGTSTVIFSWEPGVRVGGIRTSNETVDVTAIDRDDSQAVVTLKSSARLELGEFRGFLIVEVNNGQARKVRLPYRGRIVEPAASVACR